MPGRFAFKGYEGINPDLVSYTAKLFHRENVLFEADMVTVEKKVMRA